MRFSTSLLTALTSLVVGCAAPTEKQVPNGVNARAPDMPVPVVGAVRAMPLPPRQ